MGKLLIIDDGQAHNFRDYEPLFNGHEIHLAFYLDSVGGESCRSYTNARVISKLREMYKLVSSTTYTHKELVEFLQTSHRDFDQIAVDGLEGKCFKLIKEVPLPLDRTEVVTSNPSVIQKCKDEGIPYKDKDEI
jgi:hypothetical protein